MAPRSSKPGSSYPDNWRSIAGWLRYFAGGYCARCGAHTSEQGHVFTVHHLDMDPSNCRWWNLAGLCQKCHLQIQHKVVMERPWMFKHSWWFQPHVAGYYAETRLGEQIDRTEAAQRYGELVP